MDKLVIIKIGGNIIDDASALDSFLRDFASIREKKILVHGGGKLATRLADQLGIPQQMVEGRRITDAETVKLITMVYAGWINKDIVARLQALRCNALGLCGADGNAVQAHKRIPAPIDYGFAGDIDEVNTSLLHNLMMQTYVPVIAPVTHDGKGQLLNTNADTIAQEVAKALSPFHAVELIYSFEKPGVLLDIQDENSVIPEISLAGYRSLKEGKRIFAGMIPKIDNAFSALRNGVKSVSIGKAEDIIAIINGKKGTRIIHE